MPAICGRCFDMAPQFEHYIQSGGKQLRCGYTTGTCAALAAFGAAHLLLTGSVPETVSLMTPKGWMVETTLETCSLSEDGSTAAAAVRKDAGDDIDVTAGLLIFADVTRTTTPGVVIEGGEGVGRVTKPGLDQPVGAAAINRIPRQMIAQQVGIVCDETEYEGGLLVTIRVPNGAALAQKTFNPKLGIEGGISILGTSGIVEPMSMQAFIDTISIEIRQARAEGARHLILTPGNYGMDFLRQNKMDARGIPIVKCSNFIGDALDAAGAEGFESVLLVGHAGKLIKLAGGIMNTHSRFADCRTELFCAHAALCGADQETCTALMQAATTDACVELLEAAGLRKTVLLSLTAAVSTHLTRRAADHCKVGAILFSNIYGLLGQTESVQEILTLWNT